MVGYSSKIVAHKDHQKLLAAYEKLASNSDEIVKIKPEEIYETKDIVDIQSQISKIRARIAK